MLPWNFQPSSGKPGAAQTALTIDLAGAYAVGRALSKMYDESRSAKMPWFSADILLPLVELDRLPDFPRLHKTGAFREGAFQGLREITFF